MPGHRRASFCTAPTPTPSISRLRSAHLLTTLLRFILALPISCAEPCHCPTSPIGGAPLISAFLVSPLALFVSLLSSSRLPLQLALTRPVAHAAAPRAGTLSLAPSRNQEEEQQVRGECEEKSFVVGESRRGKGAEGEGVRVLGSMVVIERNPDHGRGAEGSKGQGRWVYISIEG